MIPQLESNPAPFFSILSPLILEDCKEAAPSNFVLQLHSFTQKKWLETWKMWTRREVKIAVEIGKKEKNPERWWAG